MSARIVSAAALLLVAGPAAAVPFLPDFSADLFEPGAPINNSYFPLLPGSSNTLVARGVDDEGEAFTERTERSFAGEGPEILGVRTTRMLDRAYEDDLLVEETYDFHAQDKAGNVWYLGEDVVNYRYDDDDNFLGTDNASAWRAGVNNALPGFAMPLNQEIGFQYYQEFAEEDEALDHGTVFAILDSLQVGAATYSKVLQVLEGNPFEPDAREFKFYAPGIGVVRIDEGLDTDYANPELVFSREIPLPAPLALLLVGFGALGAVARRSVRASGSPASSA
jgi:hypothetical protein